MKGGSSCPGSPHWGWGTEISGRGVPGWCGALCSAPRHPPCSCIPLGSCVWPRCQDPGGLHPSGTLQLWTFTRSWGTRGSCSDRDWGEQRDFGEPRGAPWNPAGHSQEGLFAFFVNAIFCM